MIENLTSPGVDPVDGDLIRETYPSGATAVKEHHAPVDPGPTPITHRTINKMEAIKLVITHAGMDAAAEEAMYDDPNLSLLWKRWNNWVPYDDINRDKPDVAEFLGGLIAAGHMTQAQVDALMADWPQV